MDTDDPLRVLQINTCDHTGGAALVAWNLHQYYSSHGITSWMAVGSKTSDDPSVIEFPRLTTPLLTGVLQNVSRALKTADHKVRGGSAGLAAYLDRCGADWRDREIDEGCKNCYRPGASKLIKNVVLPNTSRALGKMDRVVRGGSARLAVYLDRCGTDWRDREINKGREDYYHPGASKLIKALAQDFDVIHCHNLHGDYFDLRILPWLSMVRPVILTLHDCWLLSGHCAHSLGCERWKTACGDCPDLNIYPSIRKDATTYNWRRKRRIINNTRLFLATPSRWMMNMAREGMAGPAIVESRVVPNGIDLTVFQPGDRMSARNRLEISHDAKLVLFVGQSVRDNVFKDYPTLLEAVENVTTTHRFPKDKVVCIALGSEKSHEIIDSMSIRYVPYDHDPKRVAAYYQAADVYVHSARADTFPSVVLESLACGTPVVATAVGGIPEQIKALDRGVSNVPNQRLNCFAAEDATGILVPPGDSVEMGKAIVDLLANTDLSLKLGENAARDAQQRFDLAKQATRYMTWYSEILGRWAQGKHGIRKRSSFPATNCDTDLEGVR